MSARLAVFLAVVATLSTTVASRADKLYVTEFSDAASRVLRMNLDGSMQEELFASLSPRVASGIAVDSRNAKLYLLAIFGGVDGIYQSNLDGSALRPVLADDAGFNEFISDFDVDTRKETIYFVGDLFGSIYRVDASGGVPDVIHLAADAVGVAVDSKREQLYWIDARAGAVLLLTVTREDP
ncbi:MAG: hypothetical protein IID35_10835, partial [Planctomycetes bacterium]|nr:hypothetical protein [Planctomycetota bacterium]